MINSFRVTWHQFLFLKWLAVLYKVSKTSCRRAAATICLRPCKLTISSYLFARWHLFWNVDYLRQQHQQQVDLWPFDLESGVRFTSDVGYLCANFSLPRPLYSRVTPDVRERRQTWGGGIKINYFGVFLWGTMYKYRALFFACATHTIVLLHETM